METNEQEVVVEVADKGKTKKSFKLILSKKKMMISSVVIVILVIGTLYYNHYTNTPEYKQKVADREAVELIKKVSRHMLLQKVSRQYFQLKIHQYLLRSKPSLKVQRKGTVL